MSGNPDYSMGEIAGYLSLWMAVHGVNPAPDGTISEKQASEIAAHIVETLCAYLVWGKSADGHAERSRAARPHQRVDPDRGAVCYPGGPNELARSAERRASYQAQRCIYRARV